MLAKFRMKPVKPRDEEWRVFIEEVENLQKDVKVGIVGKYFDTGSFQLPDSYVSVIEAIKHAAWHNRRRPTIEWIDSKLF